MHSIHFLKSLSQEKNKEICRLAVDFNDFNLFLLINLVITLETTKIELNF